MFSIAELSMNPKRKVITVCNKKKIVWDSRDDAKEYFLEAMMSSEGEDYDRFAAIYLQLLHGLSYCTDI